MSHLMIVPSIRLSTPRSSPIPAPLQHLALDPFNPVGTNTQDWLHKLSQAGPHLQSIRIFGPMITSLGWEDEFSDAFLRCLQNMPCLRYLSLCSVDALDVETISRVLERVPQIVALDADFGVSQDKLLRLLTPPMSQDLKNEFPWHPLEKSVPAPTLLPNLDTLVLEIGAQPIPPPVMGTFLTSRRNPEWCLNSRARPLRKLVLYSRKEEWISNAQPMMIPIRKYMDGTFGRGLEFGRNFRPETGRSRWMERDPYAAKCSVVRISI